MGELDLHPYRHHISHCGTDLPWVVLLNWVGEQNCPAGMISVHEPLTALQISLTVWNYPPVHKHATWNYPPVHKHETFTGGGPGRPCSFKRNLLAGSMLVEPRVAPPGWGLGDESNMSQRESDFVPVVSCCRDHVAESPTARKREARKVPQEASYD